MEFSVKRSLLIFCFVVVCCAPSTLLRRGRHAAHFTAPTGQPDTLQRSSTSQNSRRQDSRARFLPNGLEVIIVEDHSIPLVTIALAVKNGSYTEPPELNGLSHLYEHMFFKQNRAIANAEDYLRAIGQLGIAYNGTTREEVVEYYFTTTSPNLAYRDAVHERRGALPVV